MVETNVNYYETQKLDEKITWNRITLCILRQ